MASKSHFWKRQQTGQQLTFSLSGEGWFPVLLSLQKEMFWPSSKSWLSRQQLEQCFQETNPGIGEVLKHPAKVSDFCKLGSGLRNPDAISTGPPWRKASPACNTSTILQTAKRNWQQPPAEWGLFGRAETSMIYSATTYRYHELKWKRNLRMNHGSQPFWPLKNIYKSRGKSGGETHVIPNPYAFRPP